MPDPTPWMLIADPQTRVRQALMEVYAYYRRTEQHMATLQRDAQTLPQLREFAAPYLERWDQMREALGAGWEAPTNKRQLLEAALGHALDFQTWRSLVRQQGLADKQAIELLLGMVRSLIADEMVWGPGCFDVFACAFRCVCYTDIAWRRWHPFCMRRKAHVVYVA